MHGLQMAWVQILAPLVASWANYLTPASLSELFVFAALGLRWGLQAFSRGTQALVQAQ